MFVCPSVRLLPAFLRIGSLVFSDFWHKDAKRQCLKCNRARFSKNLFVWPKMPEICRKTRFLGIFFIFHHLFFLNFCSKMRINNAQNMAESNFWEKSFSGRKCRKSSVFLQIFIRPFTNISLFFLSKTLTIPTIKHDSIVNKTYFWIRNFPKTARNHRLYRFSLDFSQLPLS